MGNTWVVPGRDCGDCMVCCIVPTIDDPDIQKKPGMHCRHCETGCKIYESRPKPCRDFYCAWRMLPALGPDWRPDLSGVFGVLDKAVIEGKTVVALTLTLNGDPAKIISNGAFVSFIHTNILENLHIFLALPGPPGHLPLRTLISGPGAVTLARRGEAHVRLLLEKAVMFLKSQPPRPYELRHGGNETSEWAETRSISA